MQFTNDPDATLTPDGRLVVFARGTDQAIWHRWQLTRNGDWSEWESLGGVLASSPAATINAPGGLVVFARGTDNAIWHRWQNQNNGNWSHWESLGGYFTSDPDATITRDGRLVVFGRGGDNAIWHRWQVSRNGAWSGWESLGGNFVSGPSATLNAPGGLVVFARGTDNAIWHCWQAQNNGNWSGWESLGGYFTSDPDATLTRDGRLVVFAKGGDNAIYHRWQVNRNGNWSGWESLDGNSASGPGVCLNAPGGLVAFIRGIDNEIWHTWQEYNNGNWSGWQSPTVPDGNIAVLRKNIPNMNGWVEVVLGRDGMVRFRGHVHNGGVESISFRIRVIVRTGNLAIAMVYEGHAGGWQIGSNDPKDENWSQEFNHPAVKLSFDQFKNGALEIQSDQRGDITGWLEDVGSFVAKWTVGSLLLTPGILGVIVLGVGVGSLISTGGFTSGFRIIGSTLWLMGPAGTLVALGAEGVAAIGSQSREVNQVEYDWANNEVFGGSLPPRHQIILTDTVGGNNRPFAFPRYDGKITLNLGTQKFANPMNFKSTFIHELVHAWQYHNDRSYLDYVWAGISVQVCKSLGIGDNPYDLPAGAPPFRELGLEQQAEAVEVWYADGKSETHKYFKYIVENIRTGIA